MGRIAVLALVALMMSAMPASANPPERVESPEFFVFRDPDTRFIVFVNITNEDVCAWEASGFEGPAPVDQLVPVQFKETSEGAFVVSFHAEASVEIWQLPEPGMDMDSCDLLGDGPWATGTGRFGFTDNNALDVGPRTSSFGGRTQGTVVDVDGQTWHHASSGRFQVKDGEFLVRAETFVLTQQGK